MGCFALVVLAGASFWHYNITRLTSANMLMLQPQYRQQMLGMQQMQRNNTQPPFDDSTFDFLN